MNKKILVIEDDEDIARNLVDVLEGEGYQVQHAKDGKDALDKLRTNPLKPEIILLDLMMPNMDGFQFRKEQEMDQALSAVPVVIMTADGHIEAKKLKMKARAFVKKPIDIDNLLDTIQNNFN